MYGIGSRSSFDIDLSIDGDFEDCSEIEARIFRALDDRFDSAGFVVFDKTFERRPRELKEGADPKWGGYKVLFKIIEKEKYTQYRRDHGSLQRNATIVGPQNKRVFTIELSKHEFCMGKRDVSIDQHTIRVYTLEMIAIEKLRAICQQMEEYKARGYRTPRARDFYDIHCIVDTAGMDLKTCENVDLLRQIFAAKNVPLSLLSKIEEDRDFHRLDWDSVRVSVQGELRDFDFYFDYVLDLARHLEALGVK